MNQSQATPLGTRWCVVLDGHYNEVQDFVSEIGHKLRSRLYSSEITHSPEVDQEAEDEEADLVWATLLINVKHGDELDVLKNLLKTVTYRWITIVQEGEVQSNDNGESMPVA